MELFFNKDLKCPTGEKFFPKETKFSPFPNLKIFFLIFRLHWNSRLFGGIFSLSSGSVLVRCADNFQIQKYAYALLLQLSPLPGCAVPGDPLNFSSLAGGNKDVSHSLIRGWQVTQLTPGMGNTWLINCLVTLTASQRCSQPTVHPQNLTFWIFCSGIWRKAGKPEKHRQQERAPERPRTRGTKCRDSLTFTEVLLSLINTKSEMLLNTEIWKNLSRCI